MITSARDLYILRVENLKKDIEKTERALNKHRTRIEELSKKQSEKRVDLLLYQKKIQDIDAKKKEEILFI